MGAVFVSTLAACTAVTAQQPAGDASHEPAAPAALVVAAPTSLFSAEQMALGRKVYAVYCTRCHGINMVAAGGAFFDLRTFPAEARERFDASVRNGLRAMPAWKDALKPEEIDGLWAYVIGNKPR